MKSSRAICAIALGSLLALACVGAHAFDKHDLKLLGSLTFDFAQGDRLALSSGDQVAASRGWGVRVGMEIPNNEAKTFVTQLFAGYKGSNGPAEALAHVFGRPFDSGRYAQLDRKTLDLLEQYRFSGDFRFGVGATYQFGLRLRCVEVDTGACASVPSAYPDNAWGALAQLSYVWADTFELGVRYTHIDYKLGGQRYDASTFGLFMVLGFHPFR